MQVHKNFNLQALNTFGIAATCKYLIDIHEAEEIPKAVDMATHLGLPYMIMGGGSNMLFTGDYAGTVLRLCIDGISEEVDGDEVVLHVGAGVVWDDLVNYALDRGYAGIENLALIPGTVGASPVQNIGAYGVELQDVFESLKGYHLEQGFVEYDKKSCQFGYRQSIFKGSLKGKFIVTEVRLKLYKKAVLNLQYGAITAELERQNISAPSIQDVARVVRSIRTSKLPDPSKIGNAGSFFKNPELTEAQFSQLKSTFPDMVGFATPGGMVKASAAWLIERCGLKGVRRGDAGTYEKHALVLVNHGHATGGALWALAQEIQLAVAQKFGISLEPEVNIIL
jgi:UDP-N-acetylmuramate dehydrogenase